MLMRSLAGTHRRFQPNALSLRAVLSASLLLAYVVLAGEAIHCQYYVSEHTQHEGSQSPTPTHSTHCILANHGSATPPRGVSLGAHPLPLFSFLPLRAQILDATELVASAPARAPPLV